MKYKRWILFALCLILLGFFLPAHRLGALQTPTRVLSFYWDQWRLGVQTIMTYLPFGKMQDMQLLPTLSSSDEPIHFEFYRTLTEGDKEIVLPEEMKTDTSPKVMKQPVSSPNTTQRVTSIEKKSNAFSPAFSADALVADISKEMNLSEHKNKTRG